MKAVTLNNIKNNADIVSKGDYVVLMGRYLYIFKTNGEFVAKRSDIRAPNKVAFIGEDRLLVDAGRFYCLMSLEDGVDIWKTVRKDPCDWSANFAISKDGRFAYDYYSGEISLGLVAINVSTGELSEHHCLPELRATKDIICDYDEEETPCLLQSHYCEISGKQISENGILYQYQDIVRAGSTYYWKAKWSYPGKRIVQGFFGSPDTVITNDLLIHNTRTGEQFCLIDNEKNWMLPKTRLIMCTSDFEKGYVFLIFDRCNVVVNYNERKVIACYATERIKQGCLVGDQYWISTKNGVVRKPFPLMEEIPPAPTITFF